MKSGELFVGTVTALGGAQTLLRGVAIRRAARRVASWQTTEGTVTRAELVRHDTGCWGAKVEFAYIVDGVEREGWGHEFVLRSEAGGHGLLSCGRYGRRDLDDLTSSEPGLTVQLEADIVFRDGDFLRSAEGLVAVPLDPS